ncbi:hypothetical protein [Magnetospirillum sulfuroxidans]|uniref:Uncharacterized protein n=1 Tax=Magnetospirillum sulfuroxidans TaxID=611300 RepID=A0ABS5I8Q5_9PROT|nr:hypothetical protein [Magnetospirillum sulfuroxidans]MBR9970826.1 hypothetical protein [Magnetospirillum sulfuroxidans]
MWSAWVDIARQRLTAGDDDRARFAAFVANDCDGTPCPFTDPLLVAGWNHAEAVRSTLAARAGAVSSSWRPRAAGRTHAVHTAEAGREFDL